MKKACIIGSPVAHSRSPLIHKYWLKQFGLEGDYKKRLIEPGSASSFIKNLEKEGFVGCNVTIPHKEEVISALDHISDSALKIGAVNTIWREGGKTYGSNSDGLGFILNCDQAHPNFEKSVNTALILGAGGGAKAIIYALIEKGISQIILTNRSRERAEEIALAFPQQVKIIDWEKRDQGFIDCQMLVNTTALGMEHQANLEINFPRDDKQRLITDIVYTPFKTNLLIEAEKRDQKIVTGLGMLLHQAIMGFEKWFGVKPAVTPDLEQLIMQDIISSKGI